MRHGSPPLTPSVVVTREICAMSEAWNRGDRDASSRTPLHGGEHAGTGNDRGARRPRHILLGVSHASDDPARHRDFEIRSMVFQAPARPMSRAYPSVIGDGLNPLTVR